VYSSPRSRVWFVDIELQVLCASCPRAMRVRSFSASRLTPLSMLVLLSVRARMSLSMFTAVPRYSMPGRRLVRLPSSAAFCRP